MVFRRDEQYLEVQCHGGVATVEGVLGALQNCGVAISTSTNWLSAAEPDQFAAEARAALSEARTERCAGVLLDQYRGALRGACETVSRAEPEVAKRLLAELESRWDCGRHLTTPWRVVLAGRPNVGKSSLINRLLGYERAIVFDQPGTTRDVVSATTAIDGWLVELADTAGLRTSNDPLESLGIARTEERVADADLVLVVTDVTQPWSAEETQLAASTRSLVVANKCDCEWHPAAKTDALQVSAKTGAGLEELLKTISQRLVPQPPPPGSPVPFLARHRELLDALSTRLV